MMKVQATARPTLVSLVEAHIHALVTQAMAVSRHCKRIRIIHHDEHDEHEEYELRGGIMANDREAEEDYNDEDDDFDEENEEDKDGIVTLFSSSEDKPTSSLSNRRKRRRNRRDRFTVKRRIHAADVNMALQLMGSEKLYYSSTTSTTNTVVPTTTPFTSEGVSASWNPSSKQRVQLVDFLQEDYHDQQQRQAHFPLPPSEVAIQQHWLAVDGVATIRASSWAPPNRRTQIMTGAMAIANRMHHNHDDILRVHELQSSLLSEELLLYYHRITQVIMDDHHSSMHHHHHRLSEHQQRHDALVWRLSIDPGLQELVPFLVRFTTHALYTSLKLCHYEKTRVSVRLAHALLCNPHLHLELHLHELLPCLMTAIVTSTSTDTESAWTQCAFLKRDASRVLHYACTKFGKEYRTLTSRVLQTLCCAAAAAAATTTTTTTTDVHPQLLSAGRRYGGMVGLTHFGPHVIAAFLLRPARDAWWNDFARALWAVDNDNDIVDIVEDTTNRSKDRSRRRRPARLEERDRFQIQLCQRALLDAVAVLLQNRHVVVLEENATMRRELRDLQDLMGDAWVAFGFGGGGGGGYGGNEDAYAACFI